MTFQQSDESQPLIIYGKVFGIKPGKNGLRAYEKSEVDCQLIRAYISDYVSQWHLSTYLDSLQYDDFGSIHVYKDGVANFVVAISSGSSLFKSNSLIGKTFVIHQEESWSRYPMACGIITKNQNETANIIFIIVITLSLSIVGSLMLVISCYIKK